MAATKTLIEGSTGQKIDSSEIAAGSASAATILGLSTVDLTPAVQLTSAALGPITRTVFAALSPVQNLVGVASGAGVIVDVGLAIELSAAAAASDTELTIAINWGASARETVQEVGMRFETTVQQLYFLVRLFAQSPPAAADLQVSFTANTIPATETLDIQAGATRFWVMSVNGVYIPAA